MFHTAGDIFISGEASLSNTSYIFFLLYKMIHSGLDESAAGNSPQQIHSKKDDREEIK